MRFKVGPTQQTAHTARPKLGAPNPSQLSRGAAGRLASKMPRRLGRLPPRWLRVSTSAFSTTGRITVMDQP
jgi:hypothetical protein